MTPICPTDAQVIRAKLVLAWEAIPDNPPADQVDELVRRAAALVYLIGWLDERPNASRAEYRRELERVRRGGVPA